MNATFGGDDLSSKHVLITGASSGVGETAARRFVEGGAQVALFARRGDRLARLSEELGPAAHAFTVDVSDPEAVATAVDQADEALGGLDVTINAAGVVDPAGLVEIDPALWRRTIDINLSGTFYVARESALRMRDGGGGVIINIGSDLSSFGVANFVHYCASKAGVIGLTKGMAVELAPAVRVNAVCPGPIDTPMMEAELALSDDPAAARKEAIEQVPLKRFSSPDEIVAAIRFLAVEAPFATGAVLPLDGGTTAA